MSTRSARLLAFAGFFVVTASFIPVRAAAQDGYREPGNASVNDGSGEIVIRGVEGCVRIK